VRVLRRRRRAIAGATSALAAVALAAAVAGRGCSAEDETPTGVVRAFAQAARAGDREAIFELLGPQTRQRLTEAARRATHLVGGSRRFEPLDLISVGRMGERSVPQRFEMRQQGARAATVEAVDVSGNRSSITVVRVEGGWRVELPDYPAR
jgi:hypothetical protein